MEKEKKEAFIKMTDILVNCFNTCDIFDKNEVDKNDYYNACNVISKDKDIINTKVLVVLFKHNKIFVWINGKMKSV